MVYIRYIRIEAHFSFLSERRKESSTKALAVSYKYYPKFSFPAESDTNFASLCSTNEQSRGEDSCKGCELPFGFSRQQERGGDSLHSLYSRQLRCWSSLCFWKGKWASINSYMNNIFDFPALIFDFKVLPYYELIRQLRRIPLYTSTTALSSFTYLSFAPPPTDCAR